MFEDGYNFPRRKFFQNLLFVNLYGLLGTIINFFTMWGILFGINQTGTFFKKLDLFVSESDNGTIIKLKNWEILLIAASLCSIEPVVSEKVVDK